MKRRQLLKLLGVGSLSIGCMSLLSSCSSLFKSKKLQIGILPSFEDDVILASGLSYYELVTWKDKISSAKDLYFGFNNDYIALIDGSNKETYMWVNHESVNPLFVSGYTGKTGRDKTEEQINIEKKNVGGSLFKINFNNNKWTLDPTDNKNNRIDGNSIIAFNPPQKLAGSDHAVGSFANCAGGVTPWNTILTCEENVQAVVGDIELTDKGVERVSNIENKLSWESQENLPAEHYGWVVEYNPQTQSAKKLIGLGRFAHECATCVKSSDGRTVVYMGDDKNDQHIYKFISKGKDDLSEGTLYVANITKGKWMPLDHSLGEPFKSKFKNQQEMSIFTRDAASLVGATPLGRPEDIEIHPLTGEVFVALTNNKPKGDYHGSLLKISEKNNDSLSLEFSSETFKVGGDDFSCPDNLVFDKVGNLWMTSDISGGVIGSFEYKKFANNGLFCIPAKGKHAGRVIQVASAPKEAEFTGPCFSKDFKTLFLSVQHPGEKSKDLADLHSHWPNQKGLPSPTVICIHGAFLDQLIS